MTLYKGGVGQWAWVLHRFTGVGVLLFLVTHILDTALIMLGPAWYNKVIAVYRLPIFGVLEIGLFACVLYHALNGVRIILIDFWVASTVYQKQIFYIQSVLFALLFVPVAWLMIGHILQGLHL